VTEPLPSTEEQSTEVTLGTIVACFLLKCSNEDPQLGRVLEVDEGNNLEVEWSVHSIGSYSETWRV